MRFVEMRDLQFCDWGGAWWEPGNIRKLSVINGVLSSVQYLIVEAIDDIPWELGFTLLEYDEAQVLLAHPQYFRAFSYNQQGERTSISLQEYLERKENFLTQHEIVTDFTTGNPVTINYTTPTPDKSIDELFAAWEQNPQPQP